MAWLTFREDYLSVWVILLSKFCIALFLIQSLDRLALCLGCFWIKYKKLKPTIEDDPYDIEDPSSFPMVLVHIPICNEREVYAQSIGNGRLDQGLNGVYTCPTCGKPLFAGRPENEASGEISSDEQLARQISAGVDHQNTARHQLPTGLFPNQTQNPTNGVHWRGAGMDSGWLHSWHSQGVDGAGPTTATRSVGLGRVQMMMRHLAAVGETYAQTALEDASWGLWPIDPSQASGTGTPVPSAAGRAPLRTMVGVAGGNIANILAMADTVREVLPHIPDDLIFQDLQRTNSVTVTVNNLLQM